ncbi:hypothetical protein JW926_15090 [Candidatus Sumerlaeota bacterium]|nr:hypothetical protein [Candidatus Sumerlaeota bacterium]
MKKKFLPLWLLFILMWFLLFIQSGNAQSRGKEITQKSKLIPLSGSYEKTGGSPVSVQTGCIIFCEPAESLKMTVTTDEFMPPEVDLDGSKMSDSGRIYHVMKGGSLRWEISRGWLEKFYSNGIQYKAPLAPGSFKVSALLKEESNYSVMEPEQNALAEHNILGTFVFNVMVMYPFDREGSGVIEGYPIGIYPNEEAEDVREPIASHKQAYKPPRYFIKVTPENAMALVSDHFVLSDFSPLGEKDKEHFIALAPSLVQRLEDILSGLKEKGLNLDTLKIIRGYLSPNEVERLRRKNINIAVFSRSIYGDSATFIIDKNQDDIMDDLNNDKTLDKKDMDIIEEVVQSVESRTKLYGGIGIYYHFYDPVHKDTPCVQIDTRGWHSRWGDSPDEGNAP